MKYRSAVGMDGVALNKGYLKKERTMLFIVDNSFAEIENDLYWQALVVV